MTTPIPSHVRGSQAATTGVAALYKSRNAARSDTDE